MRVAITGSSGLVGTALRERLASAGHEVIPVVRRAAAPGEVQWDPERGTIGDGAFDGIDVVVNLAGVGIADKRWTPEHKAAIRSSRMRATTLVSETIAATSNGPKVLLSGSAIGCYGSRADEVLDERSTLGDDFLAGVTKDWEASTAAASAAGVRVAHLRTGIVLSAKGGALKKQLPLFRLGLGGRFGSGRQWQSWISIDDEVGAILHLLTADVSGPVNLTAPEPVTNAEFAEVLGSVLHRPAVIPVPAFAPKLLLGDELVDALLLNGQRVVPRVLRASGYAFAHPQLEGALRALLGR